jgi:hypothetical protein
MVPVSAGEDQEWTAARTGLSKAMGGPAATSAAIHANRRSVKREAVEAAIRRRGIGPGVRFTKCRRVAGFFTITSLLLFVRREWGAGSQS